MTARVLVWLSVCGMATAAPQVATNITYPGGAAGLMYPGGYAGMMYPGGATGLMYPGGATGLMYPGGATGMMYPGACNNAACNYSPFNCCCCWGYPVATPAPPATTTTPLVCPRPPTCPQPTMPPACPPVSTCPPVTFPPTCPPIRQCPPPPYCPTVLPPLPCPSPKPCPTIKPCPPPLLPPPCPTSPPQPTCPIIDCPMCPPVTLPPPCPVDPPCPLIYCPPVTPPPTCPPITLPRPCPTLTPRPPITTLPPVDPRPTCPGPYCPRPAMPCPGPYCPRPAMPCPGPYCPPPPCMRSPTMTCPPFTRSKRGLRQQRQCELPGHCPVGYSCCSGGCGGGKVCMRDPARQVKVSVMFSSTSHLSHLLISQEVLPAIQNLPKSLKVELIPTSLDFQTRGCPENDPACLGNLIISCAGSHLHDLAATLEFSLCFIAEMTYMNGNNITHIGEATRLCMAPHPAEMWEKVYECGSSDEGKQLFLGAQYREQQLATPDMQLPSVALDDEMVIIQPSDLPTLRQRLCQLLYNAPEAKSFCQTLTYR